MSWEVERHHLDMVQVMHRFTFVNRTEIDPVTKQPQRLKFSIKLGSGTDGASCDHCGQPLPGGFQLDHDGTLRDAAGQEINPHRLAKEHCEKLNGHHGRIKAYAQKHNVPQQKAQ